MSKLIKEDKVLNEALFGLKQKWTNHLMNKSMKKKNSFENKYDHHVLENKKDKDSGEAAVAKADAIKAGEAWKNSTMKATSGHSKNMATIAQRLANKPAKYERKYAKYKNDEVLKDRIQELSDIKSGKLASSIVNANMKKDNVKKDNAEPQPVKKTAQEKLSSLA